MARRRHRWDLVGSFGAIALWFCKDCDTYRQLRDGASRYEHGRLYEEATRRCPLCSDNHSVTTDSGPREEG